MLDVQPQPPDLGEGKRIASLDVLRGVAVLGILLINIIGMGAVLEAESYPGHDGGPSLGWDAIDQALWWTSQLFVEGTMRGLFTLLFGAGFILFCARDATSAGRTDVGVLFLRRSALLILFGAFHALVLFWPGDILLIYGLAAFLLFPFRRTNARGLVAAAALLLVALAAWSTFSAIGEGLDYVSSAAPERMLPDTSVLDLVDEAAWAEEIAIRRSGLITNATYFAQIFVSWLFDLETLWWVLDALALMLLGAALLRLDIITGARSVRFYARLALLGYAIGLPLNALEAHAFVASGFSPAVVWPEATYQLSRLATTLGHLGLILLALKANACAPVLHALAKTGQMALTNYLGQSAIALMLFSGFGLGLYGSLDRAQLWLIVVLIWTVQIVFSHWWLTHFRMGPAEWVWRALTYWSAPKLLRM